MIRDKRSARAEQAGFDRPFISDDEFFQQHPHAICRIRRWKNEDDEHVLGSRGCETEFYTASIVFRDGPIYATYFPDPHDLRKRPLKDRVRHWAVDMMDHERRRRAA
jgi:hypothetical protein